MLSALLLALLAADPASPLPGAEGSPVRVERRLLVKKDHTFVTGGLGYLARGDYYNNPSLLVSGTRYFLESGGVELKLGLFLSSLNAAGSEVFDQTGLIPDAQRPVGLISAGWRQWLGFGKVLVGTGTLVHFDVQAAAHVSLLFTDRGASPSPSLGPGLLLRLSPLVHAQLDVPLVATFEKRQRGFLSFGVMPTLTVGVVL